MGTRRDPSVASWVRKPLPGESSRGTALALLAMGVAVLLAASAGAWTHGRGESMPWIAPSMAASAVLVFVLPSSPFAQPWPVAGGSCLSALVGVAAGKAFGHGSLACALAVVLAVIIMLLTRSLHPPAAAAAVLGALGGSAGWLFPVAPVGLNLVVVIVVGLIFHRVSGHTYPHVPVSAMAMPAARGLPAIEDEDIDAVLSEVGMGFDIEPDDLRTLLTRLDAHVAARVARAGISSDHEPQPL